MIKELQDNMSIFDDVRAGTRVMKVAIIDPGTNMAIRFCAYRSNGNGGIQYVPVYQYFFRGSLAGDTYVERVAVMCHEIGKFDIFKTVDLYLIEKQFELNVELSVGVIVGAISTLRRDTLVLHRKRSGNVEPESLAYQIMTIPATVKKLAIETVTGERPKPAALKEMGTVAAMMICEGLRDERGMEMLQAHTKCDDIADTICYAEGLAIILNKKSRGAKGA